MPGLRVPAACVLATILATAALAATPAERCERAVAKSLATCATTVGLRVGRCYRETGAACLASHAGIAKALRRAERRIESECPGATVQAVGYGAALTAPSLARRVREACLGEPASLAARSFGGPHAAVLAGAGAALRGCLGAAHLEATRLMRQEARAYAKCLAAEHWGKGCNSGKTQAKIAAAEARATARIGAACPDLSTPIGIDVPTYVARAAAQARCMAAASHGATAPLDLDCGPRPAVSVPPRDVWTQVVLDGATWGSRCGDGGDYAFWVKLAPAGRPAGNVAVNLQGGGVCLFEADCANAPARLYTALDDTPPTTGMLATDPGVNPFADWTMVYLPYCTQDVHFGGGVTAVFPSVTVHRYGGVNVRAALRYVRDLLWQEMAATEPEGYRPDRLRVLFAGESAGGFGVNYNYHYLLDDLRWIHSSAVPDSGIAADNGQVLGVASLGLVVGPDTQPLGWGTRRLQPPYCLAGNCGVGQVLQAASSPRLKAVPEQQFLNVTNQVDEGQGTTTFFATTIDWINALRAAYCANKDLPGIRNWLPAQTATFHTILTTASRWSSVTAGGETVGAWLANAMADPDGVQDRVDEGSLVADYPGVAAIACLAP